MPSPFANSYSTRSSSTPVYLMLLSVFDRKDEFIIKYNKQISQPYLSILKYSYGQSIVKIFPNIFMVILILFFPMTTLDLSDHPLNTSSTKQKYSFPKTKRFQDPNSKVLCESFYDIPSSFARRTTTLGYGKKTMGLQNQPFSPGVGRYNLESDINPEKNMKNSISFGLGREQMQLSGAFGHLKVTGKLPAPGAYSKPDDRDKRAHTMRPRLPDHILSKRIKDPGPGTYNHQHLGGGSYYATSKYKNFTNMKISQVSRLEPIGRNGSLGPGNYQAIDNLNIQGRYSLSKNLNPNRCIFTKSERKGVVEKSNIASPGPGQYKSFSNFG